MKRLKLRIKVADATYNITLVALGKGTFSWDIDLGDSHRLVLEYTPKHQRNAVALPRVLADPRYASMYDARREKQQPENLWSTIQDRLFKYIKNGNWSGIDFRTWMDVATGMEKEITKCLVTEGLSDCIVSKPVVLRSSFYSATAFGGGAVGDATPSAGTDAPAP